jgi:hypothetical protein
MKRDRNLRTRVGALMCGYRHRKHRDALEHGVQSLRDRHLVEELDPLPELDRRHADQRHRSREKQQADDEVAGGEQAMEEVHHRCTLDLSYPAMPL